MNEIMRKVPEGYRPVDPAEEKRIVELGTTTLLAAADLRTAEAEERAATAELERAKLVVEKMQVAVASVQRKRDAFYASLGLDPRDAKAILKEGDSVFVRVQSPVPLTPMTGDVAENDLVRVSKK